MRKPLIAPSLLSADFANLERDIRMLNESNCDWYHLDVMDGVFVPNISFGFPVMQAMARVAEKPLDVHLMIVEPEKFVPQVKALGARVMNVHQEATIHLHRLLNQIRKEGMMSGVTLNPSTPVCMVEDVPSTRALKRCVVADIPITTGIGGIWSALLPLINFCMIVVALLASRPCIPRCASSMMKYSRSLLSLTVLANVSHIV